MFSIYFFMAKEVSDKVVVILIVIAVIAATVGTLLVYSETSNVPVQQGPAHTETTLIYKDVGPVSGQVVVNVVPGGGGSGG